jgi:hypothetical protein
MSVRYVAETLQKRNALITAIPKKKSEECCVIIATLLSD